MYLSIRHSHIRLSQGNLFWREVGSQANTPLIFLHGSWNESSQWVSMMRLLGARYHCFAPDLLGFGESETPDIHYSIDLMVDCLAEYLKFLKLEKVYFVAHSLGAWIATSFALKYPEKVGDLVLISPEGTQIEAQKKRWKQMRSLLGPPAFLLWRLQFIYPFAQLLGKHEKIEALFRLRRMMLKYPTTTKLLVKRRWAEYQAELLNERLSDLKSALLVIQGIEDEAIVLSLSEAYVKTAPLAELKLIPSADGDLPESEPDVVTGLIQDFLGYQFPLSQQPDLRKE
ncbi:MAG: alpha/beta hydrolase [Microcoleaceae cyanobacterium]